MAALDGLQRPSLEALEPRLVERGEVPSAGALSSLVRPAGMIGGPALGGGLIAAIGLPATYAFDVATFAVSLGALRLIRAVPAPPDAERPSLRGIAEGFRYARGRPELLGTYGVDMVAMFFGMPNALLPRARRRARRRRDPGRPPLRGARRGRAARDGDERLGVAPQSPRRGRLYRGDGLGRGDRRRRPRTGRRPRPRGARRGRLRRHGERHLSRADLGPDDPAPASHPRRSRTGCAGVAPGSSRSATRPGRCSATSKPASSRRSRASAPRSSPAASSASPASLSRRRCCPPFAVTKRRR